MGRIGGANWYVGAIETAAAERRNGILFSTSGLADWLVCTSEEGVDAAQQMAAGTVVNSRWLMV